MSGPRGDLWAMGGQEDSEQLVSFAEVQAQVYSYAALGYRS